MTTLYVLEAGDTMYEGYNLRGVYTTLDLAQAAADAWGAEAGYVLPSSAEPIAWEAVVDAVDGRRWWSPETFDSPYLTITEVEVDAAPNFP